MTLQAVDSQAQQGARQVAGQHHWIRTALFFWIHGRGEKVHLRGIGPEPLSLDQLPG